MRKIHNQSINDRIEPTVDIVILFRNLKIVSDFRIALESVVDLLLKPSQNRDDLGLIHRNVTNVFASFRSPRLDSVVSDMMRLIFRHTFFV